jgi:hypothetical protein
MPEWLDRLKQLVKPASKANAAEYERPEELDRPQTSTPPAPQAFMDVLVALLPAALLGAGLLMTIFAERLKTWAVLGYLLLAAAPVTYFLHRIERRLAELAELWRQRKR